MSLRAVPRSFFLPACLAALACTAAVPSATQDVSKTTFVYKRVGNLEIKADVHRPEGSGTRPIVVWIHGGALIMGSREDINRGFPGVKAGLLSAGCTVVSIDYRLAPETKLPEIVSDVEDAVRWIHKDGAASFAGDPTRLAVMGGSAGGYLALTAGYRAQPRPQAVVSFFGYGDLIGEWYSQPSPHDRHRRIMMDRDAAYRQVSGPPIADVRDRAGDGSGFYQYLRRTGEWPKAVSGWDPRRDADKFTPFMPVKNVTAAFPPTLLIHGTEDTDVPYQQSVIMAEQFRRHGVRHRLITVDGAEHGFGGIDPRRRAEVFREAVEFVVDSLTCRR